MTSRVVNLLDLPVEPADEETPAGHRLTLSRVAGQLGSVLTGLTVYELEPGQAAWPYHFELVEEEWLIVVAGTVVLRTPEGERELRVGDVACFPRGAAGAHAVRNDGGEPARIAMPSSRASGGDGAVYPDSGKLFVYTEGFAYRGLLGDPAGYWEGEP